MKKLVFIILLLTFFSKLSEFMVPVFCTNEEEIKIKYASDQGYDIDGDGLFEYLEILLEANISSSGIYILEVSDLLDLSGRIITVAAYKKIFLDVGEHVFTVLLEGRMIHYSGLNPITVSYIGLISEDYEIDSFLNDIALSRKYNFTEFELPPDYKIGVKEGDWVRYRVFHFFSSTDPSETEPGNYPDEIFIKVDKIEGQMVSLEIDFHYAEEDDVKEVYHGYLEKDSQIFPLLLPANMSLGDPFDQITNASIDGTRIENLLGKDREINHFHEVNNVTQSNAEVGLEQEYLWDRRTGILMKSWFNVTTTDLLTGCRSDSNVSFLIYGTNIIPQSTSIMLEVPSNIKLGTPININAILLDFHHESVEGKQIIFKSTDNDNEIGQGITDSDGGVTIVYQPEKPGNYLIKAVFLGSKELLPSENSIEFVVRSPGIPNLLIPLLGSSLIFAIVIYFLSSRFKENQSP